jgi:acetyl-CoA/propionyl-CoA carboxylase biotin carboxyl carrier protein
LGREVGTILAGREARRGPCRQTVEANWAVPVILAEFHLPHRDGNRMSPQYSAAVFEKVLIANRGEISIRVARTLKEMGIGSVAVYSEIERDAPHVREADEAFLLGPASPTESYLNVEKILQVAKDSGAEAIHPGYGFLAENAPFAAAVEKAKLTWIGPPPKAIEAMGSKTEARQIMQKAGVPIVPGATEPVKDVEEAKRQAEEIGYPIACKAAGGGGGKGFRVALSEDELEEAFEGAAREGERFFSDPTVYLERYLEDPRHVEVQVLADSKGNVIHLGERDCSIQRRHQKLIEESPGPQVDEEMRERIGKIATDAAAAVGYRSAGTVEGLQVGEDYFFLEMNTRVQVEHCVTELVTGFDIVREQVRIAAGEKLSIAQEDVELRGHAIECRINAEAAHKNYAPAPGRITTYREPAGPGVRVDSGVEAGSEVTPMYDPMFAKLIVWDLDREKATARMLRALGEYEIGGITTLVPFHQALLATKQWANGETCRDLTEDRDWLKSLAPEATPAPGGEEPSEDGKAERSYQVEVGGKLFDVKVIGDAAPAGATNPGAGLRKPPRRERGGGGAATSAASEDLTSPLQGTVLRVAVEQGAEVSEGDLICVIEAMKMENEITAHGSGKVTELPISDGSSVNVGDLLAKIE